MRIPYLLNVAYAYVIECLHKGNWKADKLDLLNPEDAEDIERIMHGDGKCECAGNFFGEGCEHENKGKFEETLSHIIGLFQLLINQIFHIMYIVKIAFTLSVYKIHEMQTNISCSDNFEIGYDKFEKRSKEVCEQRCTQNDDCKFYSYTDDYLCTLYAKCERDDNDAHELGKTFKKPSKLK